MNTLKIRLVKEGSSLETIYLPAEIVIEMTLTISPNWIGLPKLISIVNIIEKINDMGLELASEREVYHIANELTNYYLPTPIDTWEDRELVLEAKRIPAGNIDLYQEVSYARTTIKNTVRDVLSHGSQKDANYVGQAQDKMLENIRNRVRNKPSWKTKVLDLLLKAAVTTLFESFVGFPLHTFVARIF